MERARTSRAQKEITVKASMICLCLVFCVSALASAKDMVLVDNGRSNWRIVLSTKASVSEKHAAKELQKFLVQISGAELPIVTDAVALGKDEILLGSSNHLSKAGVKVDVTRLGDEGFTIQTVPGYLAIVGGRTRGTLYGMYAFLEKYCGCRWYSPVVSKIPSRKTLILGQINDTQTPAFAYRDILYFNAFDGDWAARNKSNSPTARLTPEQGGKFPWAEPRWHTFEWLLPPSQYLEKHPEYYALIDGQRVHTQFCLTNPDVIKLVTERMKQWMYDQPDKTYFSLSQNDNNGYCRCPDCEALTKKYGNPSGTLLFFVNRVAAEVKKTYPKKRILTFAYAWSMEAPTNIRPAENVWMHFAMMGYWTQCSAELDKWSKLTDRIVVWDYVTNWLRYMFPNPNLYKLQPDIQFYQKHGVVGDMPQGNYQSNGGEFSELRAYLLSKLLWNPDIDVDVVIDDFLVGYYGKAAPAIRQYINLLHSGVRQINDVTLDEYWPIMEKQEAAIANPYKDALPFASWGIYPFLGLYVNPDMMVQYEILFQEAEARVAEDPEVLLRVQVAHLPIQTIQIHMLAATDPARAKLLDHYLQVAEKAGITHYHEGMTMEQYAAAAKAAR